MNMAINTRKKPIVIVNFKVYKETIGENAIKLAKACDHFAAKTGHDIRIAVDAIDLAAVVKSVSIPVYSEHVDAVDPGKHTGTILPEMVKAAGASGTLINHSERRVNFDILEESIKRSRQLGLITVACCEDTKEQKQIMAFSNKPDFIAIEPPELIGGDISVSTARPELIRKGVLITKPNDKDTKVKLLVGAGVKTKEDVKIAMELGADGILIASGIDLAEEPEKALKDLLIY